MITIKIEGKDELINSFLKAPSLIEKKLNEAIGQSVEIIKQNIKRKVPIDTGNLKGSIHSKTSRLRGEVGIAEQAIKYAPSVEYGTGVYAGKGRIYPKRAKVLAFKVGGKMVYARSIKGQKAQPYFVPGIDVSMPTVINIFEQIGSKIVREL